MDDLRVVPDADHAGETEHRVSGAGYCDGCGEELIDRRKQCRYCSDRCRVQARRVQQDHEARRWRDRMNEALARGDIRTARELMAEEADQ